MTAESLTREVFAEWVHDALRHLYEPNSLGKHPLGKILLEEKDRSPFKRSQSLRRVLLEAVTPGSTPAVALLARRGGLQALSPPADMPSAAPRTRSAVQRATASRCAGDSAVASRALASANAFTGTSSTESTGAW